MLNQLECNGYSSSTLAGYKCALRKVHSFMERNGIWEYSHDTGHVFLKSRLTESGYSDRWNKYIKTIIQRFDDYILGRPYTLMHTLLVSRMPEVFFPVLTRYTEYMQKRGFRPSTIETRRIYASQLLVYLEKQSLLKLQKLDAELLGAAFLASGSKEGFCEKVPAFLKYLLKSGAVDKDLSASLPRYAIDQKLPSVYSKNELIRLISGINHSTPAGKRDYAILSLAVTYGMRASDISSLKVSDIDYDKKKLTFVQSKTSVLYSVVVNDGVPYSVVQNILGHENPNSTRYYASIDIENLRNCALDSPASTGQFASYLIGGEWK